MFLLPADNSDKIESVWTFLIREADRQDFVSLDEISKVDQRATHLAADIVTLGISRIHTLEWLDRERRIYWSIERARRGWNKIINACRKILTVVPDVPFEKLATAVERARTIRNFHPPMFWRVCSVRWMILMYTTGWYRETRASNLNH